jgi:hypothetical protein
MKAAEIAAKLELEGLDCDPLEFMLRIVADPNMPYDLRVTCAKDCRKALHPDLASTQVSGPDGGPIESRTLHAIMLDPRAVEAAETLALALAERTRLDVAGEDIGDSLRMPALPAAREDTVIVEQPGDGV